MQNVRLGYGHTTVGTYYDLYDLIDNAELHRQYCSADIVVNDHWADMREHGWDRDEWPAILKKVMAADILVIGSAIWLGEKTSVCTKVIERLYAASHELNGHGQYAYYGKVGGCLITGNEDGAKHCAMNILYSLQHLGYVVPPQADAAWLGEAGPGPSQRLGDRDPRRLRLPRASLSG